MWDIILTIIFIVVAVGGFKLFSDSRSYKDWPHETWPEKELKRKGYRKDAQGQWVR